MNDYRYLNMQLLLERYPFTKGQIRKFLSDRDKNGFASCVRKIGRRIYFHTDLLNDWIESKKITSEK